MSLLTYEVKVKVRQMGQRYKLRVYHIEAPDGKRACQRAKKYGEPLTAHKVDKDALFGNIENLPIAEFNPSLNSVSPAIAMDEMVWRKRNKRRRNSHKDNLS